MQISEIMIGAAGTIKREQIRLELDQIAVTNGGEPRCYSTEPAASWYPHEALPVWKVSSGVCTPGPYGLHNEFPLASRH